MPRLPEVLNRDALPEDKRDLFEYLIKTRGSVRAPFSYIMHSPEAAARVAHTGTYVRFESSLPKVITELATLATARHFDCAYEWGAHAALARAAGVRPEAIDAIGTREVSGLPEEESLPVRYAWDLLQHHKVSDTLFDAAHAAYGDQGVMDLTVTVGYYALLACVLNAIEVVPAPEAARLP